MKNYEENGDMQQAAETSGPVQEMAGADGSAEQSSELLPLTAAERMARYRKRKKVGVRCITVELRKAEIAGLVRAGLLNSDESNDVSALKAALYRHFEETLDPPPSTRA